MSAMGQSEKSVLELGRSALRVDADVRISHYEDARTSCFSEKLPCSAVREFRR